MTFLYTDQFRKQLYSQGHIAKEPWPSVLCLWLCQAHVMEKQDSIVMAALGNRLSRHKAEKAAETGRRKAPRWVCV